MIKISPLISIIMSAYNNELTIDRCIRSIINQTYKNWELLICDDNSNDKTLTKIEYYVNSDSRITVHTNKHNHGLAWNLNYCLKHAKGKYIARMDADDYCLPTRLWKQVFYLENNPQCDIVGTSMIIENQNRNIGIRNNVSKLTKNSFLKGSPFFHPTIMMKKKVLNSLGGYSTKVYRCEDLELWFRLYLEGYKGNNLKVPLYVYHETYGDLKKRNLRSALSATKIFFHGYKYIGIPLYKRWRALKPIISCLLPNKIIDLYHKKKLE